MKFFLELNDCFFRISSRNHCERLCMCGYILIWIELFLFWFSLKYSKYSKIVFFTFFPFFFFFFLCYRKRNQISKHNHDSKNYYNRGEIQTAKRPGTRLRILGSDANYMCRRSGANEVMVHIINVAMPAPVKCKGLWRRKARWEFSV